MYYSALPEPGKAHVRFLHASPDAPAVDIAVKNGPVLFKNVAFKGVGEYLSVGAGTYDLEVRLAGTKTVALSVPGVRLDNQTVYTIFAMGLAAGTLLIVGGISLRGRLASIPVEK